MATILSNVNLFPAAATFYLAHKFAIKEHGTDYEDEMPTTQFQMI